jgi:hypothetical protein
MSDNLAAAEHRRLVQARAQSLYEESDPGGVSWARRPLTVRHPWLLLAEQQIQGAEGRPD